MSHREGARAFLSDPAYARWHDEALWFVRQKRDLEAKSLPEWEDLRREADRIKRHTLEYLPHYLEEFEKNARNNGIVVHWAEDADAHNRIVLDILRKHRITHVVKSKSMLTEECGLNPYLEAYGIEVTDTDLGERIVQLRGDRPSHIVLPAIHLKKEQVGRLFEEKLHTEPGNDDPLYLTRQARAHLREKFLEAEGAISGVNFAISENGTIVVCTNEGNADLGTSLAKVHIACMGIEKVLPAMEHLAIFTRMLARSATGQAITTYTTHFGAPAEGRELHVVIVDNGRSAILKDPEHKKALQCIRCGACMNTCPIYRRSGGHSYHYTIPGPIGSVLANARSPEKYGDLAYASTLCGSCTDICPVKIDLHRQLLAWRKTYVKKGYFPSSKRRLYRLAARILAHPRMMRLLLSIMRWSYPLVERLHPWGEGRKPPRPAKRSFDERYEKKDG